MLDDLKYIHERDACDLLGLAENQIQQFLYEPDLDQRAIDVDNIVYAGMGNAVLPGLMSRVWPGHSLPFEIIQDYDVPAYVNAKTYFIAVSLSGNCQEILSAVLQAEKQGAQIAVISGGGELTKLALTREFPLAIVPSISQNQGAMFYIFKLLVMLLERAELLNDNKKASQLLDNLIFIEEAVKPWLKTVPTKKNAAKLLALEAIGKSIVISSGPTLAPAAYKFKIDFNVKAKQLAWINKYPEFVYDEFLGWTEQPIIKPYCVIDLRSNYDNLRIQKSFDVSCRLLSGRRPEPHIVQARGKNSLQQLLWVMVYADFVTTYAALLNGLNPARMDLIDKFKKIIDH